MATETNGVTHQSARNSDLNEKAWPATASLHGHDAAVAAAMQGTRKERTGNGLSTASR